jgi:hypothetical protein
MKRKLVWTLGVVVALIAGFGLWFHLTYGGSGAPFPKMADATPPQQAEIVAVLPEPVRGAPIMGHRGAVC